MKLHLPSQTGVTVIENIFIDQYMPRANGEFVKLYLYLLRCAGSGRDLSLSSIADVFDHTEGDVKRALAYWEKLHLLKLQYDKKGGLCDILFLNGTEQAQTAASRDFLAEDSADMFTTAAQEKDSALNQNASPSDISSKTSLTRDRKRELKEQAQIKQLIFIAEQYYSRPLTSTEQSNLLYFYDTLHFSVDLIEYLIEYCVSKGSNGPHYMEKVAQEWYKDGITTVAQAKSNTNLYNKNYFTIFNSMGIKGRNPAPTEIEYMDRWLNEFGFTIEIVLEACCRTIRQTHQPNFQYANKILDQWHKSGVRQLSDIRRLDLEHSEKKNKTPQPAPKAAAPNRFNNFPQREYDWNRLEQQLLNAQSRKEG